MRHEQQAFNQTISLKAETTHQNVLSWALKTTIMRH